MGEGGFEPPKRDATDLQSAPFGHSGTLPYDEAGGRTRTPDLLITNQLLYQLSYTSNFMLRALLRALHGQLVYYSIGSGKSQEDFAILSIFSISVYITQQTINETVRYKKTRSIPVASGLACFLHQPSMETYWISSKSSSRYSKLMMCSASKRDSS